MCGVMGPVGLTDWPPLCHLRNNAARQPPRASSTVDSPARSPGRSHTCHPRGRVPHGATAMVGDQHRFPHVCELGARHLRPHVRGPPPGLGSRAANGATPAGGPSTTSVPGVDGSQDRAELIDAVATVDRAGGDRHATRMTAHTGECTEGRPGSPTLEEGRWREGDPRRGSREVIAVQRRARPLAPCGSSASRPRSSVRSLEYDMSPTIRRRRSPSSGTHPVGDPTSSRGASLSPRARAGGGGGLVPHGG